MTEGGRVEQGRGGEARMLPALVAFLEATRRLRDDSTVFMELPWHGRRVDLATMTVSGVLSAYELKLGSFGRALEQAMYNGLSFDRTWVVLSAPPTPANQDLARKHEVGVIVAEPHVRVLLSAPQRNPDQSARRRLRIKMSNIDGGGRSGV